MSKWRSKSKLRIIEAFGGECCICGYNKCSWSLALHHVNPEDKEISFSKVKINPVNWTKLVPEFRKCVLVCHNCHAEIHEGMTKIPTDVKKFNEDYAIFDRPPRINNRVDWTSVNLSLELQTKNYCEIGRMLGCVGSTVMRKAKELKLI